MSHTERKFCSECVKACPVDAIEISQGWKPEGGVGGEQVAPDGQNPERPVHVSFDKCIGCGACEFACNQIVFGDPAMTLTSYGRATASSIKI